MSYRYRFVVLGLFSLCMSAGLQASLMTTREVEFLGTCDASAAVPLSNTLFAVADDEDNIIRVYNADTGGAPLFQFDLSYKAELKPELDLKRQALPTPLDEMDIEAATTHNGLAYWITSHGRDKKGRAAPARLRFFATQIDLSKQRLSLAAPAVTDLLSILLKDPKLAKFNLAAAARKAPKAEGGLNLEGMTATPTGELILGFRNPLKEGKALLITLLNPEALLAGAQPEFGPPRLIDLDGRGVRGISYWDGRYFIAAGHYGSEHNPALYTWQGGESTPQKLALVIPEDFNIEAFFTPEQRSEIMIFSDDGGRKIRGKDCKKLQNIKAKSFRGIWLKPTINHSQTLMFNAPGKDHAPKNRQVEIPNEHL